MLMFSFDSCQTGPWWHNFRQGNSRAIEQEHQRAIDARASGELWVSPLTGLFNQFLTQYLGSSVTKKSLHTSSSMVELSLKPTQYSSAPWQNCRFEHLREIGAFAKQERRGYIISGEGVLSHVMTVFMPTTRDTAKLVVFVVNQTWLTTSQCGGCCSRSSQRKLFRMGRGCLLAGCC